MEVLEKFQLILIMYEGPSFTEMQSRQKLGKISVEEWLDRFG
jgi:hypothetical protein